jgi:hypothetical protein
MKHTYALAEFPEIGLNFIHYSHSEQDVNNSYFLMQPESQGIKNQEDTFYLFTW